MDECNICFEEKKLYNVCKTCCKKACQDCLSNMIYEKDMYFTGKNVKYNFKCPYCRSKNFNMMRKGEMILLFKKLNEKNNEIINKLKDENKTIKTQLFHYKKLVDIIQQNLNDIMSGMILQILNNNDIYTALTNITYKIKTYICMS